MVVFTCSGCGESLKKNRVSQHLSFCRHANYVTCIDCLKDFDNVSFNQHNSCLDEDERYGGLNFQKKENANKGKKKQEEWIQKLQDLSSSASVSPQLKPHLKTLLNYTNIPRKKPKFCNFLKSSLNIRNDRIVNQLWELFEAALKSNSNNNNTNNNGNHNGQSKNDVDEKANGETNQEQENNDGKRKLEASEQESKKKTKKDDIKKEDEEAEEETNTVNNDKASDDRLCVKIKDDGSYKIKYSKWIKLTLKEKEDAKMSEKKFFKAVKKWYKSLQLDDIDIEDFKNKVIKTINKHDEFIMNDDCVAYKK